MNGVGDAGSSLPGRWQSPGGRKRMTTTAITRALELPEQGRSRVRAVVLACTGIPLLVTLLIRLVLDRRSFDMFGDEVYYTDIGRSVINGGFPRFDGQLFFLHGPGFFYLEAGWERLLGSQHSLLDWIYEMRLLSALLAGATAVVLVLLATRAGSLWAGTAAGLLYAVEPYCIRQNDRVLLETAMMFWVLLGYLMFTSLAGRPLSRATAARAVGAGLFFGFAILTKDEGALLTLLPLFAAAGLRWGPSRTLTRLTIGATVLPYLVYLTVVAANGHVGAMWAAKTAGLKRMLGLIQVTGFHSQTGGSLLTRLVAEGAQFATTYATLALAVPAAVLVLRRGGQLPRMLGLLYCAAAVALGYALIGGTLEEQELYLLIVPSLLVIPVAATLLRGTRPFPEKSAARTLAVPLAAALVLVLGINLANCVQWWLQPDDGISRLLTYMALHVPPDARVTTVSGGDAVQFALAGQYQLGPTLAAAAADAPEHIRYVVVAWGEIYGGYSDLTVSQVRRLVSHDRLIFSFDERTYGDLALYLLPPDGNHPRVAH
jgi:hypothetical protein